MSDGGVRRVAARVLARVAEDAAWAAPTLDAEARAARLEPRDAALAAQIVYGTLRVVPSLDREIDARLEGDPARLDELTRAALRTAVFQLLHLARVPPHAVLNETVAWVRRARGPGLAGLVNAILRKVASERPAEPSLPVRLEVPDWVAEALRVGLGAERAERMLTLVEEPPGLALRVRAGFDRDAVARAITAERARAAVLPGALSPLALVTQRAGDPRTLSTWREGAFAVQEEGSQLVALAVGAQPGERVADLCAGHGGKTAFLVEQVGAHGHVTAIDRDARKLARLADELRRLRLDAERVEVRAADVTADLGELEGQFDRVLVDAPCSGLGTLARRPELLLRVLPEDVWRLAALQFGILLRAASLVRPGGMLAYAVCSVTREEGADVASRIEHALPRLRRMTDGAPIVPAPDPDGVVRIGPWLGIGTPSRPDGYQVVRWRCA